VTSQRSIIRILTGAPRHAAVVLGGALLGANDRPDDQAETERDCAEEKDDSAQIHSWCGPPNGARLSCGRDTRGRKGAEPQTKELASQATQSLTYERTPGRGRLARS